MTTRQKVVDFLIIVLACVISSAVLAALSALWSLYFWFSHITGVHIRPF